MRGNRLPRLRRYRNPLLVVCLLILWAAAVRQFTVAAATGLAVVLALSGLDSRFRPANGRAVLLLLLGIGGLALKDLLPIAPALGAEFRRLGPESSPLPWLPRNPDLPAASMQLGGLLLGIGLACAARERVRSGLISAHRLALTCLMASWAFALLLLAAEAMHADWKAWAPAVASKNAAATLAALGLVLQSEFLRRSLQEAQGLRLGLSLIGIALFIRALATLNSGTGIGAAAIGSALYLIGWMRAERNAQPHRWIWSLTGVAVAALSLVLANPALAGRVFGDAPGFRALIWRDCVHLLAAAPAFGVGSGAFAAVHPLLSRITLAPDTYLAHPDSGYVNLLVEWGIIPCLLLAAAVMLGLGRLARVKLEPIDYALLAGLATLAAAAITDPAFQRMPTFFLGSTLAGALAGRHSSSQGGQPTRPGDKWLPATAGILGLAAVAWGTVTWDQLKWRPLSADLQAKAGAAAWQRNPGDPNALAQLDAAVTLRRWSADFATFAALLVHPVSTVQAAPFWQLAFARGQEAGGIVLSRGRAASPATSLAYWADLTLTANPDLALQLEGMESYVAHRIATEWLVRRGHGATPKAWRSFVSFCVRNTQTAALQQAVPLLPTDDVALQVIAGRALQTLDRPADAWAVLVRAFPLPPTVDPNPALSPLSAKTLVELGRFDELRHLASQPEFRGPEAIALLELVVLRGGAPSWFRLRLAHAYAAEKNWLSALALLPPAADALEANFPRP